MSERLKDMFFTEDSVSAMADAIHKVFAGFDRKRFRTLVFDKSFETLELKQKMRHTTGCLFLVLPNDYRRAVSILTKAAPAVKGFEAMCLPDFVEVYGLEDWELSLEALACFTRYSSSEFAIRPFLIKDPERGMAYMRRLAEHEHDHVRRFASEGCRPRLPWAMALPGFKKDPTPILPVLEALKDDDSEFVRRSVANNLNDISKDHPDVVLDQCTRWQGTSEQTDWIIKHACRTLLKAGNTRAMRLFGFGDPARIDVTRLALNPRTPTIGGSTSVAFIMIVEDTSPSRVRLEYVVHFARPGGRTGRKVFQISERTYEPGEHRITKKHSFADRSTRKHYPGGHRVEIVVNGVEKAQKVFTLRDVD